MGKILRTLFLSLCAAEKQLCPHYKIAFIVLNCLCAAADFASGSLPSVGCVDNMGRVLHVTGFLTGGNRYEDIEYTECIDDITSADYSYITCK